MHAEQRHQSGGALAPCPQRAARARASTARVDVQRGDGQSDHLLSALADDHGGNFNCRRVRRLHARQRRLHRGMDMAVDIRLCGAAVEHAVEFHVEVLLASPEVNAALVRVDGQRAATVRRRADAHEDADILCRWIILRWYLGAVVVTDEWILHANEPAGNASNDSKCKQIGQ